MYSLLHIIEVSQPVARETGRTVKRGRFRGTCLFVSEGSYAIRPMLYSLLIHLAAASALLTVPIPVPPAASWLETGLLPFDGLPATGSSLNVANADIARELEAALKKQPHRARADAPQHAAAVRCCDPQTIISNLVNPTNHVQTILQPDFADQPPLKKFIPLPNMLRLAPASLGSSRHARASTASPPKSLERDFESMQSATVLPTPAAPILPAPSALSTATTAPSAPNAPQVSQERMRVGSGGSDPRDVLALSSVPVPPSDVLPIPMGESRGQFDVLAPSSPAAAHLESDDAATAKTNSESKNTEAARPGSAPDRGEPSNPSEPRLAISGASTARAPNAFPGITIQGGEWSRDSRASRGSAGDTRTDEPSISSYPLTIMSTGNSGGGLRDFGVFYNQTVYTDYLALKESSEPYAPPFVLQFALIEPLSGPGDVLTHPRPTNEVLPNWPEEIAARYIGEMVVVYAVIAEDGRIRDARVLESPSTRLNSPLLSALAQWTFRPAAINGQPAAVKALLGVPIVP